MGLLLRELGILYLLGGLALVWWSYDELATDLAEGPLAGSPLLEWLALALLVVLGPCIIGRRVVRVSWAWLRYGLICTFIRLRWQWRRVTRFR